MKRLLKTTLLSIPGQIGAAVISIGALSGVLMFTGRFGIFNWEMVASLVLIRLVYRLSRGPKSVLTWMSVPKRMRRVIVDELYVVLALAAAAFVLNWPISSLVLGVYFLVNFLLQAAALTASRLGLAYLSKQSSDHPSGGFEQQTIIIGTGRQARALADRILDSPATDTLLIGFLDYHKDHLWRYRDVPLLGHPDRLEELIATCQVDALIVAVDPADLARTRELFELAERMGVTICYMPEPFEPVLARLRPGYLCGLPTMVYRAVPENQPTLLVKAIMDRVGALVGLVIAAPIMLITALVIKLESRGPIFFKQTRSGLNGKTFELYKFRTMCADAEHKKDELTDRNEMSGPVFKIATDPRVTRIGGFLRKYSIDEVPQFINVLRGEMSLVGPRPPLPKEVSKFDPWQHRKLSVKPGVTCLWQVNGRNQIDFEEWMRLDLEYIDNWSLLLDAKILARTIPAVLKGSGS
jgi:exopolysaccharide biosynthesis polyprenyl glycosylphosphotransferase